MNEEVLGTAATLSAITSERRAMRGFSVERHPELWDGILHEFRNHLTLMLAVESELRQALPLEQRQLMSETLADMVGSIHHTSLLTSAVSVLRGPTEYRVCEVNELVERALDLAGPIMPPGADLVIETAGPAQLRNPGGAVHTALACLIAEMVRTAELSGTGRFTMRLRLQGGANAKLELQSGLSRGLRASWRVQLARELLAAADATLVLNAITDRASASCTVAFR